MKKATKIGLASAATLIILGTGGFMMSDRQVLREKFSQFVQSKQDEADKKKAETQKQKETKMTTKEKQLAYLKDHQQEIIDFVKSRSSKIESVQIDWEYTRWADSGFFDGQVIEVFGRVNNIEDSGWRVDFPINDDKSVDLEGKYVGQHINIGGDYIE